jgi:putative endonuclease
MNDNDTTGGSTRTIGNLAEDLAARFLQQNGLKILIRNFLCRGGEIDLICQDGKTLVFTEVRLRRNTAFGGAAASITLAKQRRIILAAQHYLTANAKNDADCRFDCLLLDGNAEQHIEWIRDAFSANEPVYYHPARSSNY